MKCPYRKVTYHHKEEHTYCATRCAYDEEGFADCYGKECPYYGNGYCKRVLRKDGAE